MRARQASVASASALLAALYGCVDYGFGKSDDGFTPSSDEETGTVPADSGCALFLPEAEAIEGPPTCMAFEASWDLAVEAAYATESDVFPAAAVAPPAVGAAPAILVEERDYGIVAIDPGTGVRTELGAVVNDNGLHAWALAGGASVGAVANYLLGVDVAYGTEPFTFNAIGSGIAPVIADVDQDGDAEVLYGSGAVGLDGGTSERWPAQARTLAPLPVDVNGDGALEILGGYGVYTPSGEQLLAWPADFGASANGYAQVVAVESTTGARYLAVDGLGPLALDEAGTLLWEFEGRGAYPGALRWGGLAAVGDTNGDGDPDLCSTAEDRIVVVGSDGSTLLDAATDEPLAWLTGGCALADLDADGNHEVIAYGAYGLRLYDVETTSLLAEWTGACSTSWRSPPTVADVDQDGSAEIVLVGADWPCAGAPDHVYVIGPARGRWARTRPVWNQVPYSPHLISNSGELLRYPPPNPGLFRAQPARDGAWADLAPEVVDACADDCSDGEVLLAVRVRNTGSSPAPGATVRLSVVADGALAELASISFPEEVPAGWASAARPLRVPAGMWPGHHVLDVRGFEGECDVSNDRIESGLPDPCE